ncbi:MAG: low molecular weight protein-tyrosine-phosphatase [Bacteroidota bacterium]|nr:low molecular weight protein-tyrosine-phosphatase [Bacteroidota bacterium]
MKILMVCLGNICRSPLAEGILKKKIKKHNINAEVASAGFVSFHAGQSADKRAEMIASQFGVDISTHKARVFKQGDFDIYDQIFVMDHENLKAVHKLSRNNADRNKAGLILNELFPGENQIVPDPYYGGKEGFVDVFHLLDKACDAIIQKLK